ncbi:hypothetical protein [Dissulfurispira sp.]|uniref:hypothetical protein n=1 Tax=Dissulfurispira sp. TaxID=2817609 RepID=UPI002FDB11D1
MADMKDPQKTMVMMSIERFPVGLSVPFDVYKRDGTTYSCALKKWQKFDDAVKAELKSKGIVFLYVEGEPAKVNQYFDKKPAEDESAKKPMPHTPKRRRRTIMSAGLFLLLDHK